MAVGSGLAVVFLLWVLAAFVSDYWRTARASRFTKGEIRLSSDRQPATMKNAMRSERSIDANEKIAMGMTLGTVLTLSVYASWETIPAAFPFDAKRQLRTNNR